MRCDGGAVFKSPIGELGGRSQRGPWLASLNPQVAWENVGRQSSHEAECGSRQGPLLMWDTPLPARH